MNNQYTMQHTIKYSESDHNRNLRLDYIVTHFQDITGLHSNEMEIDAKTMKETSNVFWVLSKWKIKIHRMPQFEESVTVETWPTLAKGVRFARDYTMKNGNQVLVSCCSEWCTLDCDTMRPRKVDSVHYPHDMPHRQDRADAGGFLQMKETLDKDYLHHTHKVAFTDVDINQHTNNIAYVKMALDCFSLEEWGQLRLGETQINYVSQTHFGDEIDLYKKQTDYGYYIEGKNNDKTIFSCLLICENFP